MVFENRSAAMPTLSEMRAFFERAEQLLPEPSEVSLEACKSFFGQAEQLLAADRSLLLQECQAVLALAEQQLLPVWRDQISFLRQHDPRCSRDYQSINLMEILGVARKEEPHSRFLGWLLDPKGSHGLNGRFLEPFLHMAQEICETRLELDLSEVRVRLESIREQGRPDIIIETPKCLCVIENKLIAAEGTDQTTRYADDAARATPRKNLLLLFLTPTGRRPRDARFKPMNYAQILELLKPLLETELRPDVRFAVGQFITNIRHRVRREQVDLENRLIRLLDGFEGEGDPFLIRGWRELASVTTRIKGDTQ